MQQLTLTRRMSHSHSRSHSTSLLAKASMRSTTYRERFAAVLVPAGPGHPGPEKLAVHRFAVGRTAHRQLGECGVWSFSRNAYKRIAQRGPRRSWLCLTTPLNGVGTLDGQRDVINDPSRGDTYFRGSGVGAGCQIYIQRGGPSVTSTGVCGGG